MKKNIDKLLPFWNKLDNNSANLIKNSIEFRKYNKNDIISYDNQNCSGLIIIENGVLRAYINSTNGKEITLYKLYDNDICLFSAKCALKNIHFDVRISCEENTNVYILPIKTFNILINESKEFSDYVNKILANRFSDVMWLLEQVVFDNMDKRLATYLLDEIDEKNELKITHEKIANDLGTAREVISRLLKHFEKDNLIILKRNFIKIKDEKKLLEVSNK